MESSLSSRESLFEEEVGREPWRSEAEGGSCDVSADPCSLERLTARFKAS